MFIEVLDFLKLLIQNADVIARLYQDSRLVFVEYKEWIARSKNTGECIGHVQYSEIKVWRGIEFCFYANKLDIRFKPHYFFNDMKQNANDFRVVDCIQTLRCLIVEFDLSPKDLRIMQIEYGLNFIPHIPFKDFISSLEYHERNRFDNSHDGLRFSKVSGKSDKFGKIGKYKRIKCYAKGIDQPLYGDENLIRFEVKSNRTQFIESLGIYTLEELLITSNYQVLADSLQNEFEKVLFLDYDNPLNNLTKSEMAKVKEFNNQRHWYKALQGHRNTFNNNKTMYLNLLNKSGGNIHEKLKLIVQSKLNELLKPCAILTPELNTNLVQF